MNSDLALLREVDVERLRALFDDGVAISREQVRERTGLGDRRFRLAVAALRHDGYPVVSISDEGSVYRRARTIEELEKFVQHELVNRARELEAIARAMREHASDYFAPVQMRLVG